MTEKDDQPTAADQSIDTVALRRYGRELMYIGAALASVDTLAEAYERLEHASEILIRTDEMMCTYESVLLGFTEDPGRPSGQLIRKVQPRQVSIDAGMLLLAHFEARKRPVHPSLEFLACPGCGKLLTPHGNCADRMSDVPTVEADIGTPTFLRNHFRDIVHMLLGLWSGNGNEEDFLLWAEKQPLYIKTAEAIADHERGLVPGVRDPLPHSLLYQQFRAAMRASAAAMYGQPKEE